MKYISINDHWNTQALLSGFTTDLIELNIPGFTGLAYRVGYSAARYSNSLYEQLVEKELIEKIDPSAVAKRKAEYVAGRYVAATALSSLGSEITKIPVGLNREPLWPPGYTGSISHTSSSAACIAAYNKEIEFVGIDMEKIIAEDQLDGISEYILGNEKPEILNTIAIAKPLLLTLIFSAKESLFKALYPNVKRFFGFEAATVLTLDLETSSFEIKLETDLSPCFLAGRVISGCFQTSEKEVLTVCWEPQVRRVRKIQ